MNAEQNGKWRSDKKKKKMNEHRQEIRDNGETK